MSGVAIMSPTAKQPRSFVVLDADYYRSCLQDIQQHVANPKVFLFSNDTDWCLKNLDVGLPFVPVTHNDASTAHEDLFLISKCRHAVIANSSFSWWGAFLGDGQPSLGEDRPRRKVYYPSSLVQPRLARRIGPRLAPTGSAKRRYSFLNEKTSGSITISHAPTHAPYRVVLASTQPDWGGGETYLTDLAAELRNRGTTVEFLVREKSDLEKHVREAGFSVKTVRGRGKSLATIWNLRRWLGQGEKPTVLHCNDSHALLCAGLAAFGQKSVRVVAMKHTLFPIRSKLKVQAARRSRDLCLPCDRRSLQASRSALRKRAHHSLRQSKRHKVDPAEVACLRSQLLPTEGHRLIVAIGNLVPCKGHLTLVEAAAHLKTKGIQAHTVIAGEGSERKSLEARIKTLGLSEHVRLLGFRNDADALTAAADVVVHPSREEGLGLSVAAAMMLQRPIVSTAVGGLKELLGIDPRMQAAGPFASIANPDDPQQLAHLLAAQLVKPTDPERLLEARNYAVDRFGITRMTDQTQQRL